MVTDQQFHKAATSSENLSGRLDSNARYSSRDLNEFILSVVTPAKDHRLLDVCCGTGKQLVEYAKLAGEVHGFDASEDSLRQVASRCNAMLHHGNLDAIEEALPESLRKSFDWITCSYGLYYATDPLAALRTLTEFLKPDGRIVIVGPARQNNESFYSLVRRVAEIPEFIVWSSQTFVDRDLIPECQRLFGSVTVHEFVNEIAYPTPEAVIEYWRSCGTYFREDATPALRNLLVSHFQDHQEFRVTKQALAVVASNRLP
jgi:ubiquinone/menaquinone biosynthesis C-methylase UbiE